MNNLTLNRLNIIDRWRLLVLLWNLGSVQPKARLFYQYVQFLKDQLARHLEVYLIYLLLAGIPKLSHQYTPLCSCCLDYQ